LNGDTLFMRTRFIHTAAASFLYFFTDLAVNNMEEFIAHQIELVETERKIDAEDTLKLLSAYGPTQLQRRGVALIGLKVTGLI
jgi:hypothetical protein